MKFRGTPQYQKHYESFGESLRAYYDLREDAKGIGGLEGLMLSAYRWFKFIRKENNVLTSHTAEAKHIDVAIMEAINILDEPIEYCVPQYMEADALETLSFSCFKVLKEAGRVKYCKHCDKVLNGPCKKHREATGVDGLNYCDKCGGWLSVVCTVHPK